MRAMKPTAAKCGPDYPMEALSVMNEAPAGGATSFAEVDAFVAAEQLQGYSEQQMAQFSDIMSNILGNAEIEPADKMALITRAAEDMKTRLSNPPANKSFMRRLFGVKQKAATVRGAIGVGESFVVTKDSSGSLRWVMVGSNHFKDRDEEIVTRAAHKEYVNWAWKNKTFPELRIWHVDNSRIGQADWLDEHDGFLMASGTFDNQEVAQRVQIVSKQTDLGVSMGFEYQPGDRLDKQFDWYRAFELSMLPREHAANTITMFHSGQKESQLDEKRKALLSSVLGENFVANWAAGVTDTGRKAKAAGIAYKAADEDDEPDDEEEIEDTDDVEDDGEENGDEPTVEIDGKSYKLVPVQKMGVITGPAVVVTRRTPTSKPKTKVINTRTFPGKSSKEVSPNDLGEVMKELLAPMMASIDEIKATVKGHDSALKAIAEDDDVALARALRPRAAKEVVRKSVSGRDTEADEDEDDGDEDEELIARSKSRKTNGADVPEHLKAYSDMGILGIFNNNDTKAGAR